MNNFFNSKYPIVSLAMNKVSNVDLAIAVSKEGGIPTIPIFNFNIDDNTIDYINFDKSLEKFYSECFDNELIISITDKLESDKNFYEIYLKYNFKYIEIILEKIKFVGTEIEPNALFQIKNFLNQFLKYKKSGVKFICRAITKFSIIEFEKKTDGFFDAYILKSDKSAGKVIKRLKKETLEEEVIFLKNIFPNIKIIPCGGINNNEAKKLLELNCPAIGYGTIFALSKESSVSLETKHKLIEMSISNNIENTHNGVIFKKLNIQDDKNHTQALKKGIESPKEGLIYVGHGISSITEIKSVKEIISEIVKDIL